MIEANLEGRSKEEVAGLQGADVEAETLAEGCRAAKRDFLNDRGERDGSAIRVAREPGLVRIERKYVILLEVTIREIQESCYWTEGLRHLL